MFNSVDNGVTKLLGRMFAAKKVAHAVALITDNYIDAARSLAASIICEKAQFPPCGECVHCNKAKKNIHPDIIEIAPLKGKVFISVDQIREMRSDTFVYPNEANSKVYIINGACSMNEAAQNALLLILEQPPKGVYFILCDSTLSGLLSTVVSRLTVFYPESEKKEQVKKYEEKCKALLNAYIIKNEGDFYSELAYFFKRDRAQSQQLLWEFSEYVAYEIKKETTQNKRELIFLFDNITKAAQRLQNSGNVTITLAALCAKCWEDN